MPINPERLKKLKDLSLNEYQARIYLALLDLGPATASEIYPLSRVPRTRIYMTMGQLHEKGLVNIIPERPLRYEPIPISEYLGRKVIELREGSERIKDDIGRLSKEFSVKADTEPEHKGNFEAMYGRRNFKDRLKEIIEGARKEVIFVGNPKSPLRLAGMLVPVIEDKAKEGVGLRLVFPISTENKDRITELKRFADVRLTYSDPQVDWAIVDSREMIISHPVPNDDNPSKGEDVSIWLNDLAMIGSRKTMSEELWDNGLDPDRLDTGTVLLNTVIQALRMKGLTIDRGHVAREIINLIVKMVAKRIKGGNLIELIGSISKFMEENSIGNIVIKKKKPVTIVVETTVGCQYRRFTGDPHCTFSEFFLRALISAKLGKEHAIRMRRCKGMGDSNCEFEVIAG